MGVSWKNIGAFTACLALASFSQSLFVNGFYPSSVTSLELQFRLSSSQSGLIASMYDLACVAAGIFIGCIGTKSHKPRGMAIGTFIVAVASLLFAVPKALSGKYVATKNETGFCAADNAGADMNSCKEEALIGSWAVFLISMALAGVGATMLYVLSAAYLSDNTSKRAFPFYLGIQYTATFVGTASGFLIGGGVFINLYVDIGEKPTYLKPSHPAWVGAWWLEYIVAGILLTIVGIPLLFFPKQIKTGDNSDDSDDEDDSDDSNSKKKIKNFGRRLGRLLCNPVLMFNLFGFLASSIAVGGGTIFLPKFLQQQFSLAASTASLTGGAVLVPAAAIGCLTGGFLAHKLKLTGRGSAKTLFITTCIVAALTTGFLLVCKPTPVAGSEKTTYNDTGSVLNNLTSSCNAQCRCKADVYEPTCGEDGVTYFSVCHAGCQGEVNDTEANTSYFYNCSCIWPSRKTASGKLFQATEGRCEQKNCPYFAPFLLLFFLMIFVIFIGSTLETNVVVRSVDKKDKPLALGLFQIFSHTGYVIGPVLIGAVLDFSCIMWDYSCGTKGGCWVYETRDMGHYIFAMLIVGAVISVVCFGISWWKFSPEMDKDDENDDDDDDDDDNEKDKRSEKSDKMASEEQELKTLA